MTTDLTSHLRLFDLRACPAHKHVEGDLQPEILVVDDDFSIRETLKMVLEEDGYIVAEVAEGGAALDYLRQTRDPMVVLLDHVMPGMDGAQTLHAVAQDEYLVRTHAYILLTASAQTVISSMVSSLGDLSVAVVTKPFDLDELLATVARVRVELQQRVRSV